MGLPPSPRAAVPWESCPCRRDLRTGGNLVCFAPLPPWVPGAWGGASPQMSRKEGPPLVPWGNTESDHEGAGEGREPASAGDGRGSSVSCGV